MIVIVIVIVTPRRRWWCSVKLVYTATVAEAAMTHAIGGAYAYL